MHQPVDDEGSVFYKHAPSSGMKLTDRQRDVLAAIRNYIYHKGIPPTIRELCDVLGIVSTNAVNDHLLALERKGAIRKTKGISRGIEVTV